MSSDDVGDGIRVRPTWATPALGRPQVLVRLTEPARGWFRGARYEVAYYPEGLTTSPWWVRRDAGFCDIPGQKHTTDLHDLSVLVHEAWAEGVGSWTAWPVWYPAVVDRHGLRRIGAVERDTLPPRLVRHPRRGDWVVDGPVHELTSADRTRCGLPARDLAGLGQTFYATDPQACPDCGLAWAP